MRGATPTLREWLREGPFALAMSSGFFGFYAHTGVLSVLLDAGFVPARVSGSSAGALVTGAWASGCDPDVLVPALTALRRDEFWDPSPGAGLLAGRLFRRKLHALLPERRIERARVPVAISVHALATRRTEVVTTGDLAEAIHASCAVPLLFHPVRVGGRLCVDGGVSDRPGLAGIAPGARVLFHHLSSRSPWRRAGSPSLQVPSRAGLVALVLENLPRSGPFRLEAGRDALVVAQRAARRALDLPLDAASVRVDARDQDARP